MDYLYIILYLHKAKRYCIKNVPGIEKGSPPKTVLTENQT